MMLMVLHATQRVIVAFACDYMMGLNSDACEKTITTEAP